MSDQVELWIRQAYEQRLSTWAKARDLCVEYENDEFNRQTGKFYLRATLLMAPAVESDLVSEEEHSGVFQIDVFGPARIGAGKHGELVGQLRKLFPLDGTLDAGQIKVVQRSPLRSGPGITEPDWYMVPTSFEFRTLV